MKVGDLVFVPWTGSYYADVEKIEDGVVHYAGGWKRQAPIDAFVPNTFTLWQEDGPRENSWILKSDYEREEK